MIQSPFTIEERTFYCSWHRQWLSIHHKQEAYWKHLRINIRSALFPISIEPVIVSSPKAFAPLMVAIRRLSGLLQPPGCNGRTLASNAAKRISSTKSRGVVARRSVCS